MDLSYSQGIDPSFEANHWWMRSRYRMIDRAIAELPDAPFSVLEIGAGTGVNLRYLQRHYGQRIRSLAGTDPDALAKPLEPSLVQKDIPDGHFDLILVLDVLEHCADPVALLVELRARLTAGGRLLVTVPAFQLLWTHYDELAHHVKRYSFKALKQELTAAGWRVHKQFFLFSFLFPLFVMQRLLVRMGFSDLRVFKPLPALINQTFYAITRLEIAMGMTFNHWIGSSIVALASLPEGRP